MRSGLWTIFASSKGAHVETFLQLTLDCFLPLRGKRNPSTILYRQRMRSQRASKHYQALVERQLDAAVENSLPGPVTPQPLTALLPAAESESPPTADPPAPAPPPRPPPNRLLVFDAPANLPAAAAVEPAREPSPQELLPAAPQQLRLRRRRHPALPPQHRRRERSRRHSCFLTTTPTILHRRRIRRRFIAHSIGWPSMRRTKPRSCTTR